MQAPTLEGRLASVSAWLPSRGTVVFTLLVAGALFLLQTTGAFTLSAPQSETSTSVGTVPYQGRLADADGTPLTGTYNMIFRLYSISSGGLPLWEEQWTGPNSVEVSDGLFNVMLGSLTPIPQDVITGNPSLWLGITVDTDDEMLPRVKLGSVPYAVQALTVPEDSVTSAQIADGTIQALDLAPDAALPVGTVINWWRPDASVPLPSDAWAIADGSMVTDPDSPLNGQTLPDLTERFIMGVLPENIGQAGGTNTLDLSHRHRVDSHAHSIPNHTHGFSGTTSGGCCAYDGGYYYPGDDSTRYAALVYGPDGAWYYRHKHTYSGTTSGWSGTSGTSAPYTNYQLSSTTDNRPAYVGMVFLVKIK